MNLPPACEKCAPFAGAWQEIPETADRASGLKRCDCPRGVALTGAENQIPVSRPPLLSEQKAQVYAEMLAGGMDFYPAEVAARSFIASEIAAMCDSDYNALCLVRDMHRRYDGQKWPGVVALRAVLCSFAEPLDGLKAINWGIEGEKEQEYIARAIPAPAAKQLISGDTVTASPSITATLTDLARAKDMNRATRVQLPGEVREIPVLKLTDANRVTEADVKAAVQAVRDQKAREVIG